MISFMIAVRSSASPAPPDFASAARVRSDSASNVRPANHEVADGNWPQSGRGFRSLQVFSQYGENQQSEPCDTEQERPALRRDRLFMQRQKHLIDGEKQKRRAERREKVFGGLPPEAQEEQPGNQKAHGVHPIKKLIHGRCP